MSFIKKARFKFFGNLNDFLRLTKRGHWIVYEFSGRPSVKDAIEAIGIPHVEVKGIAIEGKLVDFKEPLEDGDEVHVYPLHFPIGFPTAVNPLEDGLPYFENFVLDVHLGRLAKAMRLLGIDTYYLTEHTDNAIADLAEKERRIVLTRDVGLLKHNKVKFGYWLRSQNWEMQLKEVVERFDLKDQFRPFERCLDCNGLIKPVDKAKIIEELPEETKLVFDEFFQCENCKRVYWKGSHYERMVAFVERFIMSLEQQ